MARTIHPGMLIAAALCLGGLGACSTVSEGEIVPGYQRDGTYVLSAREQSQDCERLAQSRQWHMLQAEQARIRIKLEWDRPPTSMLGLWERVTDTRVEGTRAQADLEANEAAISAFSLEMGNRNCTVEDEAVARSRAQGHAEALQKAAEAANERTQQMRDAAMEGKIE